MDKNLNRARAPRGAVHCNINFTVGIRIDVELRDVVLGGGFDPDTLPDAATGRVEDVGGTEGLLADWDYVLGAAGVCGVVHEDETGFPVHINIKDHDSGTWKFSQFISPVRVEVLGSINSEAEIASSVETSLLPVDVDCGFVVYWKSVV